MEVYNAIKHHTYDNEAAFLASGNVPGVHSINFDNDGLIGDVLYETHKGDRDDILLVFFSASIDARATFPLFGGRSLAQRSGVSLLAFSDPSVGLSVRSGTNFYLGTGNVDVPAFILRAVEKFRQSRKLIFAGPSAGGFAALRFGNEYPDSISLAVNPTTNLLAQPLFYRNSYPLNFPGIGLAELASRRMLMIESAENWVIYAQNIHDDEYVGAQLGYYWKNGVDTSRVSLLAGNWGLGHAAMPHDDFSELISQVVNLKDRPNELTNSIGLRRRTLLEALSTIHNLKAII